MSPGKSKVQGEGDYDAVGNYQRKVREFVATHDIEKAARKAAPTSTEEARELVEAEKSGRSRAATGGREQKKGLPGPT